MAASSEEETDRTSFCDKRYPHIKPSFIVNTTKTTEDFFKQTKAYAAFYYFKTQAHYLIGNKSKLQEAIDEWHDCLDPTAIRDIEIHMGLTCVNFANLYKDESEKKSNIFLTIPTGILLKNVLKEKPTFEGSFISILSFANRKGLLTPLPQEYIEAQRSLYQAAYHRLQCICTSLKIKEETFLVEDGSSSIPIPKELPMIEPPLHIEHAKVAKIREFATSFSFAPISYCKSLIPAMELPKFSTKSKDLRWGKMMEFVPHLIDGLLSQSRPFLQVIEVSKKTHTVYISLLVAKYALADRSATGFIVYGFNDAERKQCIARRFVPMHQEKIFEIVRGDSFNARDFPFLTHKVDSQEHDGELPHPQLKTSFDPPKAIFNQPSLGLTVEVMGLDSLAPHTSHN